jgi:hypothetical protein
MLCRLAIHASRFQPAINLFAQGVAWGVKRDARVAMRDSPNGAVCMIRFHDLCAQCS